MTSPTPAAHPLRPHWSSPSLAGRKVVLAGSGSAYLKGVYAALVAHEGGEVAADVTSDASFVVLLSSKAKPSPAAKKAERLKQKQNANIEVLPIEDFLARLAPTSRESAEMFRAGPEGRDRWKHFRDALKALFRVEGEDLRGVDLSGAHFREVDFIDVDFRGADLSRINRGRFVRCRFDGATMTGASVESIEDASLVEIAGERLQVNVWHSGSLFARGDYSRAKIPRAFIQSGDARGSKFVNADLTEAVLRELKLDEADFTNATLVRSFFRDCRCDRATFVGADLSGGDGAGSSFRDADFRGATLRDVNFHAADLTGARFDDADLAGAHLAEATFDPAALARAKNVSLPSPVEFTPGPLLSRLQSTAAVSSWFAFEADIATRFGAVRLRCTCTSSRSPAVTLAARPERPRLPTAEYEASGATYAEAVPKLLAYLGPGASPTVDCVTCASPSAERLARDAVHEIFGRTPPAPAEIEERRAAEKRDRAALKKTVVAELKGGRPGVLAFNARTPEELRRVEHFCKVNLAGATLDGLIVPPGLDFSGAKFDGASLVGASFTQAVLPKATFVGATLRGGRLSGNLARVSFEKAILEDVDLSHANLHRAAFAGATLLRCRLQSASLAGCDLSTAECRDCDWSGASYDEATRFPTGFASRTELRWSGAGPPPHELEAAREHARAALTEAAAAGDDASRRAARRADFLTRLPTIVEPERLAAAKKMLQAEKFELFVDATDERLIGVVRSQSNRDLVYACRLASDGSYACCTHKLNVCGGLRGSPCKHLLVLALGLERADRLPPETLALWLASTRNRQPAFDDEAAAEALVRYKGAAAGEIDWRPTETTPEDFYAI